ncbi:restriction endonuclease subunit S [Vibrio parahaemolyticus]|nr:restriction endonuclease subunit S [Vibrio parahaemolyticus]
MSCNWPIVKLGDYCSKIGSGATPKGGNSVYLDHGEISLIRSQNIYNEGFKSDGLVYITPEAAQKLKNVIIEPNDVLINITGDSVARVCLAPNEFLPARVNQHVAILRVDPEEFDHRYLRYFLTSTKMQNYLLTIASTGGTRNALTKSMLESLEVSKPSLDVQKRIGDVLESFESKIELNSRTNQTLEEMAQAIFKSWFVDFDPVKAKMNGEQPEGMDAATASLFPEKLVESELGLIPDGWELTNIGKVSECFDKKRIPLSKRQREQKQGSIPYYGATSVMDYVDEAIFDDIYLLIGEDGSVMKDDGTPFIQYIWGPAWVNNHAHVLQGIKSVSTEQLMLFFQQTNINAYVTGAVQLKINQRNMNSIPFIKAPKEINERFYDVVAPLYAKIRAIKEENEQLAKLRDTLLPKLLSGEIELGQAQELAEVE